MGVFLKWFFIIAPFIYFNGVLDASGTPRLLYLNIALLVAYSIISFTKVVLTFPKVYTTLYSVYILIFVLSSLFVSSFVDYIEIIKRIDYFLFFILVYSIRSCSAKQKLLQGVVSFLVIIILIGFSQLVLLVGSQPNSIDNFYAISSVFSHKNIFSTVLVLSIPFVLLHNSTNKIKVLILLLILLLLMVIQTRSAFLALIISIIYFTINNIRIVKENFILIFSTGFIVLISGVFLLKQLNTFDLFISITDFNIEGSLRSDTVKERFYLWNHSLKMFYDNYFLGVGIGQWSIYFPFYGLTLWRLRQGDVVMQRPHNDFLENFAELGVLGGVIFIALIVYPLVVKTRNTHHQLIKSGLISFLIISFFSFPQERILPSLIFVLLIVNSLKTQEIYIVPAFCKILGVILLISFSLVSYSRLESEILFKKYITNSSKDTGTHNISNLSKIKTPYFLVDGTSTPIDWYIGNEYYKRSRFIEAKKSFKKALLLNPYKINILNSLGGCCMAGDDIENAKIYFQRAVSIAPYYEAGLYNLSYVSYLEKDYDTAIYLLRDIYDKTSNKFKHRVIKYVKPLVGDIRLLIDTSEPNKIILDHLYNDDDLLLDLASKSFLNNSKFSNQLTDKLDLLAD
jgi:O-antigen ligase